MSTLFQPASLPAQTYFRWRIPLFDAQFALINAATLQQSHGAVREASKTAMWMMFQHCWFCFFTNFIMDDLVARTRILRTFDLGAVKVRLVEERDEPEHGTVVEIEIMDDNGESDKILTICTCHARELAAAIEAAANYGAWECKE